MPIYGGTFKVNQKDNKTSGFRILLNGNILLNTEIPSTETFEVANTPSIPKLDLTEALKNDKGWLI